MTPVLPAQLALPDRRALQEWRVPLARPVPLARRALQEWRVPLVPLARPALQEWRVPLVRLAQRALELRVRLARLVLKA